MADHANRFICLKLADKSYYSLYKKGERGEKSLVITPAHKGQEKSEISLFDCTGGGNELLRDILLENRGDMKLVFSMSRDYLSYKVRNESDDMVTEGLVSLVKDESDYTSGGSLIKETVQPVSREVKNGSRGTLLLFSVLLSLAVILWGGFFLADRLSETAPPLLETSGMTPR